MSITTPAARPLCSMLAVMLAVVFGALLVVPAAGAQGNDIPRTPDGRPDFTGNYYTATLTPMQRPRELGDKAYMTQEEAEQMAAEAREFTEQAAKPSDPDRDAPEAGGAAPVGFEEDQRETLGAGNVGGYNWFWVDQGEKPFAIDGQYRTSIIIDPPNGRYPPMIEEAMAAAAERRKLRRPNDGTAWWLDVDGPGPYDGPESLGIGERCILGFTGAAPMYPGLYNNYKTIVQTGDRVMILIEMVHDARVVRMNSEHPAEDVHFWLGDSIGWWEGDTLVVDTTNFHPDSGLRGASGNLHLVERFEWIDPDHLLYTFTVDDPTVWTEPWTGEYVWNATNGRVYEYACHEGNYAMPGILKGARLLEEEARAAKESSGGQP